MILLTTPADLDSLKTVMSFSQSLSQWSALLIGGAVAALLATSNWRPRKAKIRCIYLLFIPALAFLFLSIYHGVDAQKNCLGIMLISNVDDSGARSELNAHLGSQLTNMQVGFLFLGIWFLAFIVWWIFDDGIDPDKKG